MAKKIEFTRTVFRDGAPVYVAGKHYDPTPETQRQVRRGNAAEVEVDEVPVTRSVRRKKQDAQ